MRLLRKLLAPSPRLDPSADSVLASPPDPPVVRPAREPREADDLVARAAAYEAEGRYPEALALVNEALTAAPNDPDLLAARGATLYAWGRFWEALDAMQRAHAAGLRSARLYRMLGWTSLQRGDPAQAEESMRKAAAAEPGEWAMHFGLAAALRALRLLPEAVAAYERALALAPENMDCRMELAACTLELGDPVAAEAHGRRAIALNPGRAVAWANLGAAIARQDRHQEAFGAYERALELEANPGEQCDSFVNFASCMRDAGRTRDALELYERSLAERPNLYGYGHYSFTLLTAGRLLEGWKYYEFRWLQEPNVSVRPRFAKPVWDGQDLRGKTIVVCVEQGFGDIIQFVRYAPYLKAMGATVILRIRIGIEQLANDFPGVDRIMYRDEPVGDFDFWISLMSLPRVFGTDLSSIPAEVPYLFPDPARVARWAERLSTDSALRVGLVWAGSPDHQRDRYRSIPFGLLSPLWSVDRVRFYSLQKGPQAADAATVPKGVAFVDLGPGLEDFADTAAAISQLDLVLCADTAVAHIAGAMGKPVWLMLPNPADFRWLEQREDSPWYPTMRLFRQDRLGEWGPVIGRVQAALKAKVREHDSVSTSAAVPFSETRFMPAVLPIASVAPPTALIPAGFCLAAETRVGILQYLPHQPLIGESLAWYGEFLQQQLDLLGRLMPPDARVMEVGAGIGAHAVFLGQRVSAAGHLFLYEPQHVSRRILQQNLAANGIKNATIMARELGLEPLAGMARAKQHSVEGLPRAPEVETLDELQLERLDWVKINADIGALDVLRGGAQTLWRLRPKLFLAVPGEASLLPLSTWVRESSYRCWRMETALFNPDNFNRRERDLFFGQTALALLAIPEEVDVDISLSGCVELS